MRFRIKKGLDIPITGGPRQAVDGDKAVETVALLGPDYVGMKPTMLVAEGDRVALGDPIFEDKKTPGVLYTAPAAGEVVAINRGAKRAFQSVVIRREGDAERRFDAPKDPNRAKVRELLVASGLWTAFRTRPFSRVPAIDAVPGSIFVTAIDTRPLAPDPAVVLKDRGADFEAGLRALTTQTDGKVFLCTAEGAEIPGAGVSGVAHATFAGPHPAGLVGTHIHLLDPVSAKYSVWHVGYQDVCAIGHLMREGRLDVSRVISIAGPVARDPRLVRARLGASIDELTRGELAEGAGETRRISGSVLSGRSAEGGEAARLGYLGRYHVQVSLLAEGRERELLAWHGPGFDRFSVKNVFMSALSRGKKRFAFTTNAMGSPRAMVPIGAYESVMPLDVLPTFLLRALITMDTDRAQALGALELDEEDLGLCTFVCPGKTEYGSLLRANLNTIERDG
ncbi:MAG: Na(+)-translocating NADH-quinone reductase subunit A [Planctomycetota bacterium]